MEIKQIAGKGIAVVLSNECLIHDAQSALDLAMTVSYDTGYNKIILKKSAVCEEFFDLSTRIAGEALQKFVNYKIRLAIVGDFTAYTSKSLKDFIYESNKGGHVYFSATEEEAVAKLGG